MSVLLTSPIYIDSVLTPVGTTVSLGYQREQQIVSAGEGTWVSIPTTPTPGAAPSLDAFFNPTRTGFVDPVTGALYAALPLDANGFPIANLIPRRDTLANLLTTIAGGVGEMSEATDVDALVRHNGVAGQAKPYYRSRLAGKTTIQCPASASAGAANAWNAVSFVGGSVIEDDLGAAVLASSEILIPAGIDYYEAILYVPWSEQAGTPNGSARRARLNAGGTATGGFFAVAPNVAATGVISETIQGFVPKQTKTNASTLAVALETYHDSATVPNLGVGQSVAFLQVLMYRN